MVSGLYQLLTIFGALCLFLFGMKVMSEGIQKFAGDNLRNFLKAMTNNRFVGILTGMLVTALVQSSSATTVMIVGFVNAGLLNLTQSIGLIMGANIGTTATAWLISVLGFNFNISSLSLPIIAVAVPLFYFSKDRLTSLGESLLGFAILFLGLDLLRNAVPDLQSSPHLFHILEDLTDYGFGSTIIFLAIGIVMTLVLQSSSATMALTLVLCNEGWIGFEHVAAIVLGENIGTTVTANLAAIVGNVHAKRAALSHTLFNIFGVVWMIFLLKIVLNTIDSNMTILGFGSPFSNPLTIPLGLSIFHSVFNILNTLIFVGFTGLIVGSSKKIIPSKGKMDEKSNLEYLGTGFLQMPEFSILQAKRETLRYCDLSQRMFNFIPEMIYKTNKGEFSKVSARITKYEEIMDRIEIEITSFLVKVSKNQISASASSEVRKLRVICSEVEKVGDVCFKMSTLLERKKDEGAYFTPRQRENLNEMFALVNQGFDLMMLNLERGGNYAKENMEKVYELEKQINNFRDTRNEEVIDHLEKGSYHVKGGFYFNKIISSCEKIGDSILNINEINAGINIR